MGAAQPTSSSKLCLRRCCFGAGSAASSALDTRKRSGADCRNSTSTSDLISLLVALSTPTCLWHPCAGWCG